VKQKLFYPDKALNFRPLPEVMTLITKMGQEFRRQTEVIHLHEDDAFYFAYLHTYQSPDALGSMEFNQRMSRFVGLAVDIVELMIREHFRPMGDLLSLHSDIANCLEPIELLTIATTDPGVGASPLDFRRHFEARRNLAIALQIYEIEKCDPEYWVAKDLRHIEQLCWGRLFLRGVSQTIWFTTQIPEDGKSPCNNIKLAFAKRRANRFRREFDPAKGPVMVSSMMCRVVKISRHRRLIIYVVNRRKRIFSTLLKMERGRELRDRRGWKYVVVGVQTGNKIRPAKRSDAETFVAFTQEHLWTPPLFHEPDSSTENPDSDENYWDSKIVGRYHRQDNGRIVGAATEQLVTTIRDHLSDKFSRTKRNHEMYRHLQVLKHLGPLWFPNDREHLKHLKSVRLPGYGVNWYAPATKETLWNWWLSQL